MRRLWNAVGMLVVLVAGTVALAACSRASGSTTASDLATFKVVRRDLRVSVTEKGALKAAKQISIQPEVPGQSKIVWLVPEGTVVKEGDVICELDRTDKAKEVEDLGNRVIQLQGQLDAAQAELDIQLGQNDADVAKAELEHHFAQVKLERFEKADYVQERRKREVRLEKAKSGLERATKRYGEMPALLKEGFVTAMQVEEDRIKKVEAETEVALAQLDLDSYEKYTATNEREQKAADEKSARLEIDRAKQRATAREAQKRADVQRYKNELANVKSSLEVGRGVLAKMTIKAPGNGILLYGDPNMPWMAQYIKVGAMVASGNTILTLPDLSKMRGITTIHESDISRVKTGEKAYVVVESANQRQIEGEVTRVAQVATRNYESWDSSKRFEVEITLSGDITGLELKPGMTARVEILVGERKSALAVPVQAVLSQAGRFYVNRRKDGVAARTEVQIEDGNAQFVVATSGLAEGDEILLSDPETIEGSAPAAEAAASSPASAVSQNPAGKP